MKNITNPFNGKKEAEFISLFTYYKTVQHKRYTENSHNIIYILIPKNDSNEKTK